MEGKGKVASPKKMGKGEKKKGRLQKVRHLDGRSSKPRRLGFREGKRKGDQVRGGERLIIWLVPREIRKKGS